MTRDDVTRLITWEEIRAQDLAKPWFVVRGNVYDGTAFLKDHPGGPDSILLVASEDATEDFIAIHSMEGRAKLAEVCNLHSCVMYGSDLTCVHQFHIGILDASSSDPASSALEPLAAVEDSDSDTFLQKKLWKSVKLVSRTVISPDTIIFRFAMPDLLQKLGLPVGQHVFVRASPKDDSGEGTLVQRAYTPVSDSWQTGFIDMLIKYVSFSTRSH
jgi:nitrate reductase (NAD(P)H)